MYSILFTSASYPVKPPGTSLNPPLHSKDIAWNLLLQSTSGHANECIFQPCSSRTDLLVRDGRSTTTAVPTRSRGKPISGFTNTESRLQEFADKDNGGSCLDTFLLLRSNLSSHRERAVRAQGGLKRGISEVVPDGDGEPLRKKCKVYYTLHLSLCHILN